MKIMIVDDEIPALNELMEMVKKVMPDAQVYGFTTLGEFKTAYIMHGCDVLFLDIEMGYANGIELGKEVRMLDPKINIIYVTGYSQYMPDAFKMHASGYLMKPASEKDVRDELENLRYNVRSSRENKDAFEEKPELTDRNTEKGLFIRCFGNFEAFYDDMPIVFERKKTKELLAYLIDRNGAVVSSSEICGVLWESEENEKSKKSYLRTLTVDLVKTFEKLGIADTIIKRRNCLSVNKEKIKCDYYRWLRNEPEGIRAYNGEYMTQYSWAEYTHGCLIENRKTMQL